MNQTALLRKTPETTGYGRLFTVGNRSASALATYSARGRATRAGKARVLAASFVLLVVAVTGLALLHPQQSDAATNGTVNFQARLMSAAGAIAADGNYNVEFKLYTATSGGSALWTEDYLNSNTQGIHVANGYLSANLGSITSFPSTINWDQDLYLGMTIRGTGSCSFGSCSPTDAEMTPRLKLTSTPYAFSAGKVSQFNGTSGYTSTFSLQAPTGGDQIFQMPDQGAAGTYHVLTSETAASSFIQLQSGSPGTAQTGNINITGTGIAGALQASSFDTPSSGALTIGASNATSITIGKSGVTTTISGGLSVSGGAVTLTGNAASYLKTSNTTTSGSITVQSGNSSSGTAGSIAVDTGTSSSGTSGITIGATNAGTVAIGNATSTTTINGTSSFTGNVGINHASSGNPLAINGITTSDANTSAAQLLIGTNGLNNGGIVIQGVASQTAWPFRIENSAGGTIAGINANGSLVLNSTAVVQSFDQSATSTNSSSITLRSGNATGTTSNSGSVIIDVGTATGTPGAITIGSANSTNVKIGNQSIGSTTTFYGNIAQTASTGTFSLNGNGASSLSTSSSSLSVTAAGSLNLLTAGSSSGSSLIKIQSGNSSAGVAGDITIDNGTSFSGTSNVTIGTTNAGAVTIGRSATTTTIQGATSVGTITASGSVLTSTLDTASAGTLAIGNTNATTVNVATNAAAHTVAIGTGAAAQAITIGSTNSTSALTLQAGSGGITMNGGSYTFSVGGTSVGGIDSSGRLTLQATSDSGNAFVVKNAAGTTNELAVINSTDTVQVQNLNTVGSATVGSALIFGTGSATTYITPLGASVSTRINIPNYDPGAFNQIIAIGLPSSANTSSRAITIADARSSAHQPSIALLSPDENQIFGLSWDGSNTTALLKNTANNITLQANSVNVLTASNSSGAGLVTVNGTLNATSGFQLNGTAGSSVTCTSGNVLSNIVVSGGIVTGGSCATNGGGVSPTLQDVYNNSAATDPQIQLSNTNGGFKLRDASSSTIGNLFQIQDSTGATTYLGVTKTAVSVTGALNVSGNIAIGSSAGSGATLTNNGATINSTLALSDMPSGGSIGSAASTVDIYTAISLSQTTNAGQTITIPTPTASTTYGRLLYLSNIGTKSFTLLGSTINPGATATLVWANTNGGASWTFSGADGSSILNQTATSQSAGFKISGTGYAAAFDAATAGALNIGGSVATSLNIGSSSVTSTLINATSVGIQTSSDNASTFSISNSVGATVFSSDTTNTAAGTNLALNSGAEAGTTTPTSWAAHGSATLTRDTGVFASGTASAKAATTGATQGVRNNVGTALSASTTYNVSFSIRTATASITNANLGVVFSPDGTGSNNATCVAGSSNVTIGSSAFTKFSCIVTTTSTTTTGSAYLAIYQIDATTRSIYVDNLNIAQQNSSGTSNTGIIRIGGANSQGLTLLTLDSYAGNPFTGSNKAMAGSMYFDTTAGSFQCYDGTRWGACGVAANTSISLTPEYPGAVLHGSGVGSLTADFCSDDLNINDGSSAQPTICGTGETNNFYKWTATSGSAQTYSIYVSSKLPSNFKNFVASSTTMQGKTDLASNIVQYSVYKNVAGAMTQCGSAVSVSSGVQTTWQTGTASGSADPSACSFAAGNSIVFKVDVTSLNSGDAYAGNINFQYTSQ